MSRFNFSAVIVAILCVSMADPIMAQPPRVVGSFGPGGPTTPPVFSPYLNMLRDTSPPAINYFGLVRPQITAQARFGALQQQINSTQQQLGTAGNGFDLPVTGQPAFFLNTGGYFMNNQVGASTSGNRLPGVSLPGSQGTTSRPTGLPYRR